MKLPTFIGIGPGRTGSTWMYELLRSHPHVCMADGTKETLFFSDNYHKGTSWYQQFFSRCDRGHARGEISNNYIYDPMVPERIKQTVPDVTLLSVLRNPFERIQSVFLYEKRNGRLRGDFEDVLANEQWMIEQNRYCSLLENYLDHFSRDQLHILFYEDLESDPRSFADEICDIVGVDDSLVDRDLISERINPGAKPRHWLLGRTAKLLARGLRRVGWHSLLNFMKRNERLRSVVMRQVSDREKQVMSKSVKKRLLDEYGREMEGVERLTGRELDHWREM